MDAVAQRDFFTSYKYLINSEGPFFQRKTSYRKSGVFVTSARITY